MFFYKNWDKFCNYVVSNNLLTCTAEQAITMSSDERFIVLKHDVESNVSKAYKLASIEHKYGISGSFYVQAYLLNDPINVHKLKEMQSWGHEISYHYDVLDANAGDFEKAESDFAKFVNMFFANGFYFKTICQHGNPVKNRAGYSSNRDFFRNPEIRSHFPGLVDVVVNFSQYIKQDYKYISDAGYKWNIITEPETNDLHPDVKNVPVGNFRKLSKLLDEENISFVISTHPHRWSRFSMSIYLRIVFFRVIRISVLTMRKIPIVERMLNKFYYLAKKI